MLCCCEKSTCVCNIAGVCIPKCFPLLMLKRQTLYHRKQCNFVKKHPFPVALTSSLMHFFKRSFIYELLFIDGDIVPDRNILCCNHCEGYIIMSRTSQSYLFTVDHEKACNLHARGW